MLNTNKNSNKKAPRRAKTSNNLGFKKKQKKIGKKGKIFTQIPNKKLKKSRK